MKKLFARIVGSAALSFAALLVPFIGARAITISPPYFDYSLNPGDTVLDVIKVYNEDPFPITLYPQVQNFTYTEGDEEGTPSFYPPDEDPQGTALAQWITIKDLSPITLEPEARANIEFSINVPASQVQPGGHFGAILLSTEPPNKEGGSIGIATKIASLILVRVSGDVVEQASLAEFGFKDPKVWYNYLPVDFFIRFENSGNTHLRPTGNLLIKNWYGRQVAAPKVNEAFASVLPLSRRRFEFGWQHLNGAKNSGGGFMSELGNEWRNFAFGKYTATLVLNYGSKNQILSDERVFYVWPWRLMTIFGTAVLAIVILFSVLMKVYNKAVIRKYELEKAKKK